MNTRKSTNHNFMSMLIVLVIIFSCRTSQATDIPVDEILQIIQNKAEEHSQSITSFKMEFIYFLYKTPLGDQEIAEKINAMISRVKLRGHDLIASDLERSLWNSFEKTNQPLRVFKNRIWRASKFQRTDQVDGSIDNVNHIYVMPYEEGMSFINTGMGNESYLVHYPGKKIEHNKNSRYAYNDDVLYFFSVYHNLNEILTRLKLTESVLPIEVIRHEPECNSTQDVLRLVFKNTPQLYNEIEIEWREGEPLLRRHELIDHDEPSMQIFLDDYFLHDKLGRYVPRFVQITMMNPQDRQDVEQKSYELIDLEDINTDFIDEAMAIVSNPEYTIVTIPKEESKDDGE
ncbi:MAG: hypothetical protein HPY51_19200 [Candidatus Omnitrophica bacterium]|nr:hypothetical protein [Candidatus Omnitrophota bacterium]